MKEKHIEEAEKKDLSSPLTAQILTMRAPAC
jgi:hypothetical protein